MIGKEVIESLQDRITGRFTCEDIKDKDGNVLFNELFIKTKDGPVLPSVEYKFGCLKNNFITNYGKDSLGKIFIMKGDSFLECLSFIWNNYKNMSDIEILDVVNGFEVIKKMDIDDVLRIEDILDDEIRRNELVLESAKMRKTYIKRK